MRKKQEGITFIGLVILAAFLGLFVFATLRLLPFYLEQMKIASLLEDIKMNMDNQEATLPRIKSAINKRLNIEMVRDMRAKDFKITKTENGYSVQAVYERRAPYVANVYLVVVFDKTVEILR
jgi:hypothetical protein